jgi:methyltransferase (TIGR00027 family)
VDGARASVTAIATALMRATHTRLERPALIDDPWGDRLILAVERAAMLAGIGAEDLDEALRAHPSYGTVILRARYAEDALEAAVAAGVRQYVIVGAGMDSFALRRPAFAREVEVFEVDHPASQAFKTARLAERGISLPARLHLVAADLGETRLDVALAGSAFDRERPAFFAWLGVTVYLTRAANLATFAAIAACATPASELVFSYIDRRVFDSARGQGAMREAAVRVAAAGEPWVSGFDPDAITEDLQGAGLELIESLGPTELAARYCAGRRDGFTPTPGSYVARARVAGR